MITRICHACKQRVEPKLHCPRSNKKCDWWICPLCTARHCNGRTYRTPKETKK